MVGDIGWKDYQVSIDYFLPGEGSAKLWGRAQGFEWGDRPYTGYGMEVDHSGTGLCGQVRKRWRPGRRRLEAARGTICLSR